MPDRIEREIEDILRKIDDLPKKGQKPPVNRARPRSTPSNQSWLSQRFARITLGQIMFWSLVVVILAFFFRSVPFASWVMIVAIVILVGAFVLSLRGGSNAGHAPEKRWRGEVIDIHGPSLSDRIKGWFNRR